MAHRPAPGAFVGALLMALLLPGCVSSPHEAAGSVDDADAAAEPRDDAPPAPPPEPQGGAGPGPGDRQARIVASDVEVHYAGPDGVLRPGVPATVTVGVVVAVPQLSVCVGTPFTVEYAVASGAPYATLELSPATETRAFEGSPGPEGGFASISGYAWKGWGTQLHVTVDETVPDDGMLRVEVDATLTAGQGAAHGCNVVGPSAPARAEATVDVGR